MGNTKGGSRNLITLDDYRLPEEILRRQVGDKFCLAFYDDEGNCYVYKSPVLNAMELCFMADTINRLSVEED